MEFHGNILKVFQVIEWTRNDNCQISKQNNYKTVQTIITVLVFCIWSDDALCFYEVSLKYLEGFSSYRVNTK